eukprot:345645-Rhodomonas_salina.2
MECLGQYCRMRVWRHQDAYVIARPILTCASVAVRGRVSGRSASTDEYPYGGARTTSSRSEDRTASSQVSLLSAYAISAHATFLLYLAMYLLMLSYYYICYARCVCDLPTLSSYTTFLRYLRTLSAYADPRHSRVLTARTVLLPGGYQTIVTALAQNIDVRLGRYKPPCYWPTRALCHDRY